MKSNRLCLTGSLLVSLAMALPASAQPARHAPLDFQGRMLLALSDADMLASAYVDGRLGPIEGSDALSVITLAGGPRAWRAQTVAASNSVAGPPVAVATTPDGRFAFVVETFTPRPAGRDNALFGDLRPGNRLQVIDLADPARLQIVQTVETGLRPDAVSVSADGSMVAVTLHPAGSGRDTPLMLYPFAGGRLGAPETPAVPRWRNGERLIHAEFHPREPVLGLVNESRAEIAFVRVVGAAGSRALQAWGNVVQAEKSPYMLRFTPDGRHAIANALYWGPDVQGTWNEAPRGSTVSIRLDARRGADGTPVHALVSRAGTGVSPEGLAISPDGRWVVTTNLERSYLPYDDPRQTFFSSITLQRLDPSSGALTRVADYAYDGILPEAAAFDASSRFVAVVTYDHYDDRKTGGSVDFWRLARDPLDPERVELVKTEHSVPVTRGAHSLVLVR
jgi:DNA-binding beta-propeller fold protein YncE